MFTNVTNFPTLTLEEEFNSYLQDALFGTNITDVADFLNVFCNDYLGIACCKETEEEMMIAVCEEPFVLTDFADEYMMLYQD